jgi:cell division protein ZapE
MAEARAEQRPATPSLLYDRGVAQQRWEDDATQRAVLAQLDRIHAQLAAAESSAADSRWWTPWRRRTDPQPIRGLYLWGAVGRGKTFLVDLLFQALPLHVEAPNQSIPDLSEHAESGADPDSATTNRTSTRPLRERGILPRRADDCARRPGKLRLHFHRFMGRVHAELGKLEGRPDPLRDVAAHFAAQARVFCLDEFFVTDIGDAMILAGLLRHLFERGVTLVTTSNIEPKQLYRDGLQRAKFLPAIALLEQHCAIVPLLSAQDYRLRALTQAGIYFSPLGPTAEHDLAACFERLAPGSRRTEPGIQINGRAIAVKRRADGVIWFDFGALCEGPRAVADYIELAQSFNTVLISGVPQFSPQMDNAARRFINLVDEFYDHGVNLVLSAAVEITDLYHGERLRAEFARTASRLIEMQSAQYLTREHR